MEPFAKILFLVLAGVFYYAIRNSRPPRRLPRRGYVWAVLTGFAAVVFNFLLAFEASILWFLEVALVIFGVLGFGFGFRWPSASWRWGLWLSIPMWVIFLWLTIVGAGGAGDQVLRTIPPVVAVLAGCVASCGGARLASRRGSMSKSPEK